MWDLGEMKHWNATRLKRFWSKDKIKYLIDPTAKRVYYIFEKFHIF